MIRRYANRLLDFSRSSSSVEALHRPPSPSPPTPCTTPSASTRRIDPYTLVAHQLSHVRERLTSLLTSSSVHAGLSDVARLYFLHPSTQIRPLLVLLFARATNGLGIDWDAKRLHAEPENDPVVFANAHPTPAHDPLTRSDVLNGWDPSRPDLIPLSKPAPSPTSQPKSTTHPPAPVPTLAPSPIVLPSQLNLAQILEMIHIASILHHDVSDHSPSSPATRFPRPAAMFGDKLSILAGDFLLARSSAAVSRLGDSRVVELTSSIIANIAEGEVIHTRSIPGFPSAPTIPLQRAWTLYLQKTYLKTASLMAKGARASVVLGGGAEGQIPTEVAYAYGRNFGLAFQVSRWSPWLRLTVRPNTYLPQLLDDIIEYESAFANPGSVDQHYFTATGPMLYAWEEHSEMGTLLARSFELEGDLEVVSRFPLYLLS